MKKPLLTAIIFTFNHKNHIARCIESHLNQKTSYDYIIKIYDDCSDDGTGDICREYAKKYPDRIKLKIQKENAFTKPYTKMQSYQAICELDTKYFCICDGDDYWLSENKVQMALDFLENHPEYEGWAHDTYNVNEKLNARASFIHQDCKFGKIENPVTLSAKSPFFYVSSRVFRTSDYAKLKMPPIDYLNFYYHLAKGPFYFHDEIMAVYTIGENNTYLSLPVQFIHDNSALMPYRLAKMLKFKEDKFCTDLLILYEERHGKGDSRYSKLIKLKEKYGIEPGWHIWAITTFAFKYGFKILDTRYIYNRKKAWQNASVKYRKKLAKKEISDITQIIEKKYLESQIIKCLLKNCNLPQKLSSYLEKSKNRKRKKILELGRVRKVLIKREKANV